MTVASFVAAQRTDHAVPHAVACRALEVSESWFYKWRDRPPTPRQERRVALDAKVKEFFDASDGTYGSPRVHADLIEAGWVVNERTVAASMAAQGLMGRPKKRRRCLTRPDKAADPVPDLVRRDFTAGVINQKWCGDLTEIPTDEGKLYLAIVEDLASRRLPGFALGEHHDAPLAAAALKMAAAVRGGKVTGVTQSMGRVGSALDNATSESWNSTLEFELLSRRRFATKDQARQEVAAFIDRYNTTRRHSTCEMRSPVQFEAILAARAAPDAATVEPDQAA